MLVVAQDRVEDEVEAEAEVEVEAEVADPQLATST
jgi:hypothetical protein